MMEYANVAFNLDILESSIVTQVEVRNSRKKKVLSI